MFLEFRIRGSRVGGFFTSVVSTGFAGLGLIGCDSKPPAPPAQPPAAVTVSHPLQKEVIEWDIYTGHLEAPQSANVAARVSGLVMEMPFTEGAIVKTGDLLAVIDDSPFKADLDSKKADQQKAEAAASIADVTYKRLQGLRAQNAVAQQEVDNAKATVDQAYAAVASAKAAAETSQLNLGWCKVLSPIDGRVSNKLVTVGNLVNGGAGQATLLTTVQSVSPMYCYFDVDEHSVLKYQKLAIERKLSSVRDGKVPCYLSLGDEEDFPHQGTIDFEDNHVDPTTGTQHVRGIFENKSGLLTPGFFARVSVPGSGRYKAFLVPETAIGNDQSEKSVMVVDKDKKVEARPIKIGALFGKTLRAVTSGLGPDDLVITNGLMHVRPGAPVAPTEEAIKDESPQFSDPGKVASGGDSAATQPSAMLTTGNP